MKNIPKDHIDNIAWQATSLIDEIGSSIGWVDHYLKAEERSAATFELKKVRRNLSKIKYSLLQKPAAALYGESQVGKSYLIKNLLSLTNQTLEISDPLSNISYDFLEQINPKGDQTEATSVVTRFSVDKHFTNDHFPIAIRLLSAKDVVLLLCDSYFNDITDHQVHLRTDSLENEIQALADEYAGKDTFQIHLSEDDIFDIQDYLEQYFRGSVHIYSDVKFWSTTASFIHLVPPTEWYRIFQIIWGRLQPFNHIFNKLVGALEQLNFSTMVFAEFKSVLREYGTILHVARLRELENGPVYEDVSRNNYLDSVHIMFHSNGKPEECTINKSTLCALCGELIFQINPLLAAQKSFLNNADLLDFPGARSRLENRESVFVNDHEGAGKSLMDLMVLRGKVSYIFNKYSRDRLISNLLFCNKDAKIEVKYIPRLLNDWIETYVGKTPVEREQSIQSSTIPPIFIIFTFFNNDLRFNETNDRPNNLYEKWTKRFVTIFQNEIITKNYSWLEKWKTSTPKFQNLYLLRDFIHSKDTFKGYSESGAESEYSENNFRDYFTSPSAYFNELRNSFLDFSFVKDHFYQPEMAWSESAEINKDGSALIIQNLAIVSTNVLRTTRFVSILQDCLQAVKQLLEYHHHHEKADEEIKKAARTGAEIHANMNSVFSKNPFNFGLFVRTLTISERDIYNFYHERLNSIDLVDHSNLNEYIFYRESSPRLSNNKSYEENIEVLRQTYHRNDAEEVISYFAERGIDLEELFYGQLKTLKNNSIALAEALGERWFSQCLDQDRFQSFIKDGFSPAALSRLLENIKLNFKRQGIAIAIADKIKHYVDRYDKVSQAEEMIADISASMINEYVNSAGWSYFSDNEKEKINITSEANQLGLALPQKTMPFLPISGDALNKLFQDVDNLNHNLSKSPPDEDAVKNVPVIRQYRRWRDLMKVSFVANCHIPTYDVEGNRKLGELLENINTIRFTVE
jgi:hypothetical protein